MSEYRNGIDARLNLFWSDALSPFPSLHLPRDNEADGSLVEKKLSSLTLLDDPAILFARVSSRFYSTLYPRAFVLPRRSLSPLLSPLLPPRPISPTFLPFLPSREIPLACVVLRNRGRASVTVPLQGLSLYQMIRDSVELNVPPAAVQYRRCRYISRGGEGIILLFYRVPRDIEHTPAGLTEVHRYRVHCCWPGEKVGVHICRSQGFVWTTIAIRIFVEGSEGMRSRDTTIC